MNKHRKEQLDSLIRAEFFDGFDRGRNEGYAVAERILLRFTTNRELKVPKSPETLEEWARKELEALRVKQPPADPHGHPVQGAREWMVFEEAWRILKRYEREYPNTCGGMEYARLKANYEAAEQAYMKAV